MEYCIQNVKYSTSSKIDRYTKIDNYAEASNVRQLSKANRFVTSYYEAQMHGQLKVEYVESWCPLTDLF